LVPQGSSASVSMPCSKFSLQLLAIIVIIFKLFINSIHATCSRIYKTHPSSAKGPILQFLASGTKLFLVAD
jgi:hypothetical protein